MKIIPLNISFIFEEIFRKFTFKFSLCEREKTDRASTLPLVASTEQRVELRLANALWMDALVGRQNLSWLLERNAK